MTSAAAPSGPSWRVEVVGQLDDGEVRAVSALVEAATEADGVRPLSEHVMLHLRYGGDERVRNVLAWSHDDEVLGYAHLDVTDEVEGASAELVVHPDCRRQGLGRAVLDELIRQAPDTRLRLWAHGEHSGATRLAESLGFHRSRVLWQMRRSLYAALPAVTLPTGVRVRTFEPGRDDTAWVELNRAAFAAHPEQGGWTLPDLHQRMAEPWFDPAGFFLAEREGTEREGTERDGENPTLVGFHWTKVHGGEHRHGEGHQHAHHDAGHGHDPIGEVYVVGVHPSHRGTGLGRALTLTGLRHLRQQGLPDAMLFVESDNAGAVALYHGLGFTRWSTDVRFVRDAGHATPAPR